MQWDVIIDGPEGSPYEGGHFKVEVTFPQKYPMMPPKLKFATKIYHPNVDKSGLICLDIIRNKWAPSVMMKRVLEELCHLLANPVAYGRGGNAESRCQFLDDRAAFDKTARRWTREYAK